MTGATETGTVPGDVGEAGTGMLICWPGPLATACVIGVGRGRTPDDAHLVLRMDPVDLMLTPSPQPHGVMTMARFLRELAQSATEMADWIDRAESASVIDYSAEPGGVAG